MFLQSMFKLAKLYFFLWPNTTTFIAYIYIHILIKNSDYQPGCSKKLKSFT